MSADDLPGLGCGAASLVARGVGAGVPGFTFTNLTGELATLEDVQAVQLPALQKAGPADLVTLTVGGNDLMTWYPSSAAEVPARVAEWREALRVLLSAIRVAAPRARIAVADVYDPSDNSGALAEMTTNDWPAGPAALAGMNAAIAEVAAATGARLARVHARFQGHGRRAGPTDGAPPGPDDGPVWYCRHIHPNRRGAREIAAALREAVGV
jgi:lysophospholipase L1-like esterase